MEKIAMIKSDDDLSGDEIIIGIEPITDDEGIKGYRVIASNGDDVGYCRALSREECIKDIELSWARWKTFEWLIN